MNSKSIFSKKDKSSPSSASHNLTEKKSAIALVDNRPNQTAQRVMQLKTQIENFGQPFTYDGSQVTVGKSMKAKLDPKDKKTGESAVINKDQDEMMDAIRDEYNLKGNEVVKGHLLNDNLGGLALDANLFPISGEANKVHLHNVESVAKDVYELGQGLYYTVDVESDAKLKKPNSKFKVKLATWDPTSDKIGTYLTTNMNVSSHLARAKRKRAEVSGVTVGKNSKLHLGVTKTIKKNKRQKLPSPNKRVSDLTKKAKAMRDKQPLNYDSTQY